MAERKRGNQKTPKKTSPIRTGGFVGDSAMEEAERWQQDGCGVSEKVRNVGTMPNEDLNPPEMPGHLT